MRVYWLEQTESDVPPANDWLGPAERERCSAFRVAKRRTDWRLGRWTAKCALAAYLDYPRELADIEIQAAPSGAPEAFLLGQPAPATISLSHRGGSAICAVAPAGVALGCDLESVEPHSDSFLADYFTEREQMLAASVSGEDRDWLVALLWSAKESALKALGTGLRLDPRATAVTPELGFEPGGWSPLRVDCGDGTFSGWWQWSGVLVRTMVGAPAPGIPSALEEPPWDRRYRPYSGIFA